MKAASNLSTRDHPSDDQQRQEKVGRQMTRHASFASILVGAALVLTGCDGGGGVREQIRGVGSSTVLPFAKLVAEQFSRQHPQFRSPIMESTGTGAGFALFCSGIGADTPDIANASRRIKPSEFAECQANGVDEIVELQVGLDGIALASARDGMTMNLTPEAIYRAIAARPYGEEQTAENWSDIDPSLPDRPILVYGPPTTSGTFDALKELVLEVGCAANPQMAALAETDEDEHAQICTEVRRDGAYVFQGEQDNLIVQKIEGNPRAIGVFGFSYLEENSDKVQGLPMNGVEPTYENIASFDYLGARPLYVYVKKAHIGAIPGLQEFLQQWQEMWGTDGPLSRIGLVVSPSAALSEQSQRIAELDTLSADDLT
jgi:phosphate transport system substrate-binding protein